MVPLIARIGRGCIQLDVDPTAPGSRRSARLSRASNRRCRTCPWTPSVRGTRSWSVRACSARRTAWRSAGDSDRASLLSRWMRRADPFCSVGRRRPAYPHFSPVGERPAAERYDEGPFRACADTGEVEAGRDENHCHRTTHFWPAPDCPDTALTSPPALVCLTRPARVWKSASSGAFARPLPSMSHGRPPPFVPRWNEPPPGG